ANPTNTLPRYVFIIINLLGYVQSLRVLTQTREMSIASYYHWIRIPITDRAAPPPRVISASCGFAVSSYIHWRTRCRQDKPSIATQKQKPLQFQYGNIMED